MIFTVTTGGANVSITTGTDHTPMVEARAVLITEYVPFGWSFLGWLAAMAASTLPHYAAFLHAEFPQQLVVNRHQPQRQLHPCALHIFIIDPLRRIELRSTVYKTVALPLSYKGNARTVVRRGTELVR